MYLTSKAVQSKTLRNLFLIFVLILFFSFQNNLHAQQNSAIEITGGFTKSQESGIGTIITFSQRITGNLFLTASTGYLSFSNSKKDYNPFNYTNYEMPIAREKFIIPLELGGLIEFGEQKFRPFVKFSIGYNYAEYFVYSYKSVEGNIESDSKTVIDSDYITDIAASYGIGMGTFYFLNDNMKIGINFMMQDVNNVNRYLRLMAGISYEI